MELAASVARLKKLVERVEYEQGAHYDSFEVAENILREVLPDGERAMFLQVHFFKEWPTVVFINHSTNPPQRFYAQFANLNKMWTMSDYSGHTEFSKQMDEGIGFLRKHLFGRS